MTFGRACVFAVVLGAVPAGCGGSYLVDSAEMDRARMEGAFSLPATREDRRPVRLIRDSILDEPFQPADGNRVRVMARRTNWRALVGGIFAVTGAAMLLGGGPPLYAVDHHPPGVESDDSFGPFISLTLVVAGACHVAAGLAMTIAGATLPAEEDRHAAPQPGHVSAIR